jgi:hypothetical protein
MRRTGSYGFLRLRSGPGVEDGRPAAAEMAPAMCSLTVGNKARQAPGRARDWRGAESGHAEGGAEPPESPVFLPAAGKKRRPNSSRNASLPKLHSLSCPLDKACCFLISLILIVYVREESGRTSQNIE